MKTQTNKVLLLASEFDSAHRLREVTSRAGFPLELELVASREEFFSHITRKAPALILVSLNGLSKLPVQDVLRQAGKPGRHVPVVVLGDQDFNEAQPIAAIREGAADYVRSSELERLPLIFERLFRRRKGDQTEDRWYTESEQAAQVLRENQKLATIGRLTASIAHEINNPLESITNLLYLLDAEAGMSEAAKAYLALAKHELERVVQISRQTLNFYRETPTAVRIQPAELLEEILVLYARKIHEKQLRVIREFDGVDLVNVFPGELRQVFSNLITNAIEASSLGGKMHLRARRARRWSDGGPTGVRVSIGDTGSGIPAEVRLRIGEPFFTTKGLRGTGLGLWVTQSILHRYSTHLQVQSSTNVHRHGTVFSVFLPANSRPQPVPISGGSGLSSNSEGAGSGLGDSPDGFRHQLTAVGY